MSNFITGGGNVSITLTGTQKVAVYTQGVAQVYRNSGYANYPAQNALVGTVTNGQTVFGTYTGGATVVIEASGGLDVYYEVGTDPVVKQGRLPNGTQVTPIAETVTVTLTAADILSGMITGTHTAGATQTYTLPTGALLEAASSFDTNEFFDWVLINLSAAAADTVTVAAAASGHTVVGTMVVASAHATTGALYGNAAQFRTVRTAASTFITYRIA